MKKFTLSAFLVTCIVCFLYGDNRILNLENDPSILAIHGTTLYMCTPVPSGRVLAFDISHPEEPKLTAEYKSGNNPCSMVIDGTLLYVVDGRNLLTFDISQPYKLPQPSCREISSDPVRGPVDVAVKKGNVYLACRSGGIMINGVPFRHCFVRTVTLGPGDRMFAAGPRQLLSLDENLDASLEVPIAKGTPVRLRRHGDDLYLASGFMGFAVYHHVGQIRSVWTGDEKFLLNTGKFRVPVMRQNADDPFWQIVKLDWTITGPLKQFSAFGTFVYDMDFDAEPTKYVYLAAGESGVVAADISDPVSIKFSAVCEDLLWHVCRGIVRKDRLLYVHDRDYGLRVVDIRDPLNMKVIGGVPLK